jgi:carboxyl-terminal processing protease
MWEHYMKNLMLILLFILSACAQTHLDKNYEEYWQETEFNFGQALQTINNKNCHRDNATFFACIEAFNELLSLGNEPWFVFKSVSGSNEKFKRPAHAGEFLKDVISIHWIELNTDNKEIVLKILKPANINKTIEYRDNWIKYFDNGGKFPFDELFERVLTFYRNDKSIHLKNENYFAGSVYNQYLKTLIGPHSFLLPRAEEDDQDQNPDRKYYGLGFRLSKVEQGFVVDWLMENGPAYKAGLLIDDVITDLKSDEKSDWLDVKKYDSDALTSHIRGPESTLVELKILRNKKPLIIKAFRGEVVIKELEAKVIGEKNKLLYMSVSSYFSLHFCSTIENMLTKNLPYQGIILDLRGNGGGSSESSRCLAGMFLKKGTKISTQKFLNRDLRWPLDVSTHTEVDKSEEGIDTTTPLVVLIDRNSASASEKTTAALQDHNRAIVIGEKSFGKGTTLQADLRHDEVPYMSDEEDLYLFSVKKYIERPSGKIIEGDGITPDIYMDFLPNDKKINMLTNSAREANEFHWHYVYEFKHFKKWQALTENIERNKRLEACSDLKEPQRVKHYNSKLAENRTRNPDFLLMGAIDLFECLL